MLYMVKDLQAKEAYDLIIKDFTGLWDSVASSSNWSRKFHFWIYGHEFVRIHLQNMSQRF